MRGKQLIPGMVLENFNTKLQPETKDLITALTKIKSLAGHRELIEDLLDTYARVNPHEVKRAREYVAFLKGEPVAAEPQVPNAENAGASIPVHLSRDEKDKLKVFSCIAEAEGLELMIAAGGKSAAAQLLGITYRKFMPTAKEVDDQEMKDLAISYPRQPFCRAVGSTDTWTPTTRQAKAYRG